MKTRYKYVILLVIFFNFLGVIAQNQELIDNDWFVQMVKEDEIFETTLNWDPELRFKIEFLSDKMVVTGCCGGKFESNLNYIGGNAIQFLNLTEIDVISCNESSTMHFYLAIKSVFNSMVGEIINYSIVDYPTFPSGIKTITLNHPTNNMFVDVYNTPNEVTDSSLSPYWAQQPPLHIWSLTSVVYQEEVYDLPYGAAIAVADVFKGTFTIFLCGDIFVAINFSWFLDVTELHGPCFISCANIESTTGLCEPVEGYDESYLQNFKQRTIDFMTEYSQEIMTFIVTLGSARKLVIEKGYPSDDKLVFHSNENYTDIDENDLILNVTIYPNPAVDEVFIYNPTAGTIEVGLYNISGKLVLQKEFNHTNNTLNISDIEVGVYFLVVETPQGEKTVKKVVKK